jgi:hypothetical protein
MLVKPFETTAREARDRGYNLMITVALVTTAVAFGLTGYRERETGDMFDDLALVVTALVAIIWYRSGRSRFRRSVVPLGLILMAIAAQALGVLVERDDAFAVGDNSSALLILVPLLAVSLWEYIRPLPVGQETGVGLEIAQDTAQAAAPRTFTHRPDSEAGHGSPRLGEQR